jgi:hypothetical protein
MSCKDEPRNNVGGFGKLGEILLVMGADSIEDERLFSVLSFAWNKQRCRLSKSMRKCVRLMAQELFILIAFLLTRP